MRTKAFSVVLLAAGVVLAGCQNSASLNLIHIGMTKDQVVGILGQPDSTSAQANVEYLTYYLTADAGYGRNQPYIVRLFNGRVESFGRFAQLFDLYNRPVTNVLPGDPGFPSPGLAGVGAAPAMTVGPSAAPDLASEIQRLKALKDAGVLTDDEFRRAKAKLLGDDK